jgi:DNA topoisomerase-1
MSSLVIVESPAKAKTINKILGKGFRVEASVGHVKDLPAKELGVDVDNGFAPSYGIIPGKEKVVRELKRAAKGAEAVYLAQDPDREGEAIAFHVASELGGRENGGGLYRVAFNEITERAVKEAIEHPGRIDMHKVEAQQARRVLDRLVGYGLSPLLWKKVRRGLSAGRVQSVAVRLVVEREKEIGAFKKEEYWTISARLKGAVPPEFSARLYRYGDALVIDRDAPEGRRFLITGEQMAKDISGELARGSFALSRVEKKLRKRSPQPPFITSTLQQEAARKFGFAAKKTMLLAQQLYEGIELGQEGSQGLITYMRTDSVRVAREAQEWARALIGGTYGNEYLPPKPPVYKSKASAQEAHEAIRPTMPEKTPRDLKPFLSRDHLRLYTLIWNRFIASQMKPAELEQTTFDMECAGCTKPAVFRASGSVVRFPGFTVLYTETADETEEAAELLPPLKEGDPVELVGMEPAQHFTQPPPRYSEATLVKALEEKGIGRPSTYAAILSTIVDRKYVHREQGRFAPTELGTVVNDYLVERFPELLDVGFTAKMEDELDRIETGKFDWKEVVSDFYRPFSHSLTEAAKTAGKVKPEDIPTDVVCDKCGSPMVIRWGRHGRFMACTGYPKCKNTKPLEGEKAGAAAAPPEPTGQTCEKCGAPMVLKSGRFGKFLACSRYPECKNTRPVPTGVKCPEDGGDLIERRTRQGKPFWSCSNYPRCKFALWQRPVPEKCPQCGGDFLVIKKDKSGKLLKACARKECGFKEEVREEEAA